MNQETTAQMSIGIENILHCNRIELHILGGEKNEPYDVRNVEFEYHTMHPWHSENRIGGTTLRIKAYIRDNGWDH